MEKELVIDIDDFLDKSLEQETDKQEKVEVEAQEDRRPEPKAAKADPDPQVENLKRERDQTAAQLAAERSLRQVAEKLANDKATEAASASAYAQRADYQAITAAIAATTAQSNAARAAYKEAFEAGNADNAAQAQEIMARAQAELLRLGDGKAEIEAAYEARTTKRPAEQEAKPEPKTQTPDDWINSLPAVSREWMKEHREYADDPKMHKKLVAVANLAIADDIEPHTQKFIDFLEDKLGLKESDDDYSDDEEVEVEEVKPAPKKVRTMAAAPVSRGNKTFSSANPGGRQVKLSTQLVAFCKETGQDPKEYAANAVRAIKEGKLPKNFLDPDYNHAV